MFTSENKNGTLVIFLTGRIDSNSAEPAEKELNALRAEAPEADLVLDAEKLEYISSAGLRVVLRLRKANPTMRIINVTDEIYDIFEMTGFSEIIPVERAFKTMSVEGCKEIGRGAKGAVYRYNGDTAVKVYLNPDSLPDINRERELARRAFVLGVPTAISYAIVKVGESYGSVFELLDAKSFSELLAEDPTTIEKYVGMFTDLLKTIHTTKVGADEMPDIKILIGNWLKDASSFLTDEENKKLADMVAAVPDTDNMLHCDYHTNNVMLQNGEAILIDMDTLSHGHPVFELANIHIAYVGFGEIDHAMVENFIHLPYDMTCDFWNRFIRLYTGKDGAELEKIEDKVRLLSYVRLLRHYSRRNMDPAARAVIVEKCVKMVKEALAKVESLTW